MESSNETSDIAHDKMRNEFEQLIVRIEESVRDYIDRGKALMMKLEQHGMQLKDKEKLVIF